MKKLSIYTFLVAAVLFTGCSQKEVEVSGADNSESALNNIDNSNIQNEVVNDSLVESSDNGYYYMINGKKELIQNIYFGFDKYSLTTDIKMLQKRTHQNYLVFKQVLQLK